LQKNIGNKKCFKLGYTDDIKSRIQVYKTGSNIKLIYYIAIAFDGLQTEECIKNTNKIHRLKKKTDDPAPSDPRKQDLCYLSLKTLKDSIQDCLDKFTNHICRCNYCKKKLHLDKLDTHLCD
jgi:hypothetical protein